MARLTLFSKTKELEVQTDEFCDTVSEGALAFRIGVSRYLAGNEAEFDESLVQVKELEQRGDELRRSILHNLYVEMLIPDSRADVLELLELTDKILNACQSAMWQFAIEKPRIPPELKDQFAAIVDSVVASADALVTTLRGFFHGSVALADHAHKVRFYETEADRTGHKLMRRIFDSDLDLSHKNQLRALVLHIDDVADNAEDVADKLTIFALKRSL